MLRALATSLLTTTLAFCVGCVVTPATWQRATSAKLRVDHYPNAVHGCLLDRSVSPPRVRALVVAYVPDSSLGYLAIGSGETEYVVIDLTADGAPVWPFADYSEKNTHEVVFDVNYVWDDLPEEQRQALSSVHFDHRAFDEGARAVRSRDFLPANRGAYGIDAATMLDSTEKHPVTFYWPASQTPTASVLWTHGKLFVNSPWPDDAKRLVLPWLQPRTLGGRASDMLFATVMLPAELALDVFATPMAFGYFYIWGDNGPPFL